MPPPRPTLRSLLLSLVAACGGAPADPDGGGDTGAIDALTIDAITIRCTGGVRFEAPLPIASLRGLDLVTGSLSPDELTIHTAGRGIAAHRRASVDAPFGPPQPIALAGVDGAELSSPSVSGDGRALYVLRTTLTPTTATTTVLRATRADPAQPFTTAAPVPDLAIPGHQLASVHVLPDEAAVYLSTTDGTTPAVYRAARAGARFATPVRVDAAVGLGRAVVSRDELTLVALQPRPAPPEPDVVVMLSRSSTDVPFANPTLVPELANRGQPFVPAWISHDGCRLYGAMVDDAGLSPSLAVRLGSSP